MEVINDSINHPLRFVIGDKTYGQFYNSKDKKYHLAQYHENSYLCGKTGNFSPNRSESKLKRCKKCFDELQKLDV